MLFKYQDLRQRHPISILTLWGYVSGSSLNSCLLDIGKLTRTFQFSKELSVGVTCVDDELCP